MHKEMLFQLYEQNVFIQSQQPSNVRNISLINPLPGSRIASTADGKKCKPLQ
ncbi:hypothetical protein [Jeotgalibacillus salarius]|uniref:hypothetical protein n=1 Tax=Jeotgalibacillus salarius TaxID=546023 RepID=UPI00141B7616|nr:hypothetical protein [Jeotgalibacillus salarius]